MDAEMLNKVQALLSGLGIWELDARYGVAEPLVTVRIFFLYHLIERDH